MFPKPRGPFIPRCKKLPRLSNAPEVTLRLWGLTHRLRYSGQLSTRLEGQEEASWKPRSPKREEALAGLAEVLHLHIPRVGAELTRPRLQDGTGHALPEVGGSDDWGGVVFCGGVVQVVLHHVIIVAEVMGNRKAYQSLPSF